MFLGKIALLILGGLFVFMGLSFIVKTFIRKED